MKIKINDSESYQFNVPEEISQIEFLGLLSRFEKLAKMFNKDSFQESSTPTKIRQLGTRTHHYRTEEDKKRIVKELIDAKIADNGTQQKVSVNNGLGNNGMQKAKSWILKYRWTPSDFGMDKFPFELHKTL